MIHRHTYHSKNHHQVNYQPYNKYRIYKSNDDHFYTLQRILIMHRNINIALNISILL